ncbi:MAG TPA: ATP-binding cassette domain-containing protein [Acidimicrobiales bacterium]|nr:ATP-binding cassette domain-containing protein [Acidimicrobiales bacterium]
MPIPPAALRFDDVNLDRPPVPPGDPSSAVTVLCGVDWEVGDGERWVVLGPNGSGKTTLFELASGYLHPTRGTVEVLGARLGRTDVRRLRRRIGITSSALAKKMVGGLAAADVVVAGCRGALEPWWASYSPAERAKARRLLAEAGFAAIADRPFGVLSDGERQQVLLARALISEPELLLLDEPAAGLDVGGRERLVAYLARLARRPEHPTTVMITHHVEEIPDGFTHVLLLRAGSVVASGPLGEALTEASLSETFGLSLCLSYESGRWSTRAR